MILFVIVNSHFCEQRKVQIPSKVKLPGTLQNTLYLNYTSYTCL